MYIVHLFYTCTHIRYVMRTDYYTLIVRDKGHSSVVNVESSPQQQEWENTKWLASLTRNLPVCTRERQRETERDTKRERERE